MEVGADLYKTIMCSIKRNLYNYFYRLIALLGQFLHDDQKVDRKTFGNLLVVQRYDVAISQSRLITIDFSNPILMEYFIVLDLGSHSEKYLAGPFEDFIED